MTRSFPLILVLPGASLMEVTDDGDSVRVHCPGCGGEITYHDADIQPGGRTDRNILHENDCPVLKKIRAAEARLARMTTN